MISRIDRVAAVTGLEDAAVAAVARLLEEGATVPFISRYRKEATGSLDEVRIIEIRDRLEQLRKLDERRSSILGSLLERDLLTEGIRGKLQSAGTLAELEDIYLPYRPKRMTRAGRAREKGLEPLAGRILLQRGDDPYDYASSFIAPDAGVESPEDAVAGASDIIAEMLTHDAGTRSRMRRFFWERGAYRCSVVTGKEEQATQFRDYFDWREPVRSAPSHRVLAMRRGQDKGFLSLHIEVPEEDAMRIVLRNAERGNGGVEGSVVRAAAEDGFRRLLAPSMENETMSRSKEAADDVAIGVFTANLRNLLLAPPLGRRSVMAVDPGFRTGCKIACIGPEGALLETATIYPFASERARVDASSTVLRLLGAHGCLFIAVGNGTGGRETEAFLEDSGLPEDVKVLTVNESGASVYSASETAREEFPKLDVTLRGAVSIGRRLQDPLAELVKIDPRAIGVGQYQHDVDPRKLRRALDDTVSSCVNSVGVDLNTASPQLLSYVSGLKSSVAGNIVSWRVRNGPFRRRDQLMEVRGMGPAIFQQSAGFLRIRDGGNPLDGSAVHPESYPLVERMASSAGVSVDELMADPGLRASLDIRSFVGGQVGIPTLRDIMDELERPGRDPRESFSVFRFADVHEMKDLKAGMLLPGKVTNVTNFGAFVDIGVHRDGLVHISEMSEEFVRDPGQLVSVGDTVKVRVLEVDTDRKRISLSMK